MCEAIVYLVRDGKQEQIMRDVVLLQPEDGRILLAELLGERKSIRASIQKIDFLRHTVYLTPIEENPAAASPSGANVITGTQSVTD